MEHVPTIHSKLGIFNTIVKLMFLNGCEIYKVARITSNKLQVFINCCLRRILKIFWPETIRNDDLLHITQQLGVQQEMRKRK